VFVTHDPWIARHTNQVIMLRDGDCPGSALKIRCWLAKLTAHPRRKN
jgi:ABC-type lipoprotein export system ATPase subunit